MLAKNKNTIEIERHSKA